MLDRVLTAYSSLRHSKLDERYEPAWAITGKTCTNPNARRLTLLLPPWHGGGAVYEILARRLAKEGSAVLRYAFHGQILEPNAERVRASFHFIQQAVVADIEALTAEKSYESVDFIASSLGNVSLALIASRYRNFRKASMVVAGSNLARSVWEGSRTQALREAFEAQGLDEQALDTMWTELAPKNHAEFFSGKEVAMHVSTADTVIPTHYQIEMAEHMRAVCDNATVTYLNKGHAASVIDFCMRQAIS